MVIRTAVGIAINWNGEVAHAERILRFWARRSRVDGRRTENIVHTGASITFGVAATIRISAGFRWRCYYKEQE